MPEERDTRKIERRARALLLNKDIPPQKMEVVRALMHNESLLLEEKYRAIIELIQTCPDRKVTRIKRYDLARDREGTRKPPLKPQEKPVVLPLDSALFINGIYRKYRRLKFFKKRWLIHANNRFGFAFRKRLVPTRRLLRAMREILSFQGKLRSLLPGVLTAILEDQSLQDATHFNYLTLFHKGLMHAPMADYSMESIRWMDRRIFESELAGFITAFFSFSSLNTEAKEQILLLVENKLRQMDDLRKEEIRMTDPEQARQEKEKRNLEREKRIYDNMVTLRSFLPSGTSADADTIVSRHLALHYGINSLTEFLVIILEALVFQREITLEDIRIYFRAAPPAVSAEQWDYSLDALKKVGKDPESRKQRMVDSMKGMLAPYEELFALLKLRIEGQDILRKAFEDQWKIVNRRQQDSGDVFEEDFYYYLDECLNYFQNAFLPFVNGSTLIFEDGSRNRIEGVIFGELYFAGELKNIAGTMGDMYHFRTNNPNIRIGREEARKILQGKIRSMAAVARHITAAGEVFYRLGKELQALFDLHQQWVRGGKKTSAPDPSRTSLQNRVSDSATVSGRPIPYHDCRVVGFQDARPLSKLFLGRNMVSESLKGGIIIHLLAFSYQMAHTCLDDSLSADLETRKDLQKKIKDLSGE